MILGLRTRFVLISSTKRIVGLNYYGTRLSNWVRDMKPEFNLFDWNRAIRTAMESAIRTMVYCFLN